MMHYYSHNFLEYEPFFLISIFSFLVVSEHLALHVIICFVSRAQRCVITHQQKLSTILEYCVTCDKHDSVCVYQLSYKILVYYNFIYLFVSLECLCVCVCVCVLEFHLKMKGNLFTVIHCQGLSMSNNTDR